MRLTEGLPASSAQAKGTGLQGNGAQGTGPQDKGRLRKVLGRFSTGVTVVTADAGTPCGMTANAFTSVSLDPPSVLVCISRGALYRAARASGRFAVSVLAADQEDVARYFADHSRPRGAAEFDAVGWLPAPLSGTPVLKGALAWLDCAVTDSFDGGDHEILLGEVLSSGLADGLSAGDGTARDALVFFCGGFHRLAAGDRPTPGRPAGTSAQRLEQL
jgi:flavin reductase (DIM6/NTAB) family NADH-FMN oxidoreductase RutF